MKQKLTTAKLLCLAVLLHAGSVFSQVFTPLGGSLGTISAPSVAPGEFFRINSTATSGTNFFTQYFNGALPSGTLGFGVNDRWISSGQIAPPSGQVVTGYRVQRNGRAFFTGLDGASATGIPDPIIQWGGNSTLVPAVAPGDLLFRSFTNPLGSGATPPVPPVIRFRMTGTGNSYAEGGFLGQLTDGTFGQILGTTNQWISLGRINGISQTLFGQRIQRNGRALVLGFDGPLQSIGAAPTLGNAIIQWIGGKDNTLDPPTSIDPGNLDFKVGLDPTDPSSDRIVLRLLTNGNIIAANNTSISNAIAQAKFAVYDGTNPIPGIAASTRSFFSTGAIYGVTDGRDNTGAIGDYAVGVAGDVANASFNISRFGLLGIAGTPAAVTGFNANLYGVFSIGRLAASGAYIATSDEKLKINIIAEKDILEKIMQLQPMTYEFNRDKFNSLSLDDGLQHGIMAQNLEKIFPEMVTDVNPPTPVDAKTNKAINPLTFKGIKPFQLISVLIKGMQEQQEEIQQLQKRVASLETAAKTVTANSKGYTLSQNVPNPFTSNTTISFTLSNATDRAILMVTDLNGKMLLQYNLAKGSTQQLISGNSLPAGIYIYSLVVNGNEVMSKKMVLTK